MRLSLFLRIIPSEIDENNVIQEESTTMEKELIRIKVADLIPYERNPRNIPQEAVDDVRESFRQCGVIDPIEIDENNVILSGHSRRLAAIAEGIDEVEALRITGLPENKKRKYRLLANKTGEKTGWNYELLAEELDDLDFGEYDFGWDLPEDDEAEKAREDDYDVNLPAIAKSKPGEIYRLGKHRLMCGSSTDPEQVRTLMGGQTADLLLTDPPYGVDYVGGTGMMIENDNLAGDEFLRFLRDAFNAADQTMRPGAAFYIWHADSNGAVFRNACDLIGWQVRQCLIWVKNSIVMGRQDYQWKHEPCLYGWKAGAAHYFTSDRTQATVTDDNIDFRKLKKEEMLQMLQEIFSDSTPTTVIYEDKPLVSDVHPTMKPVRLMARLVANSSRKKERVLDLFGGSGSTLIACEQLERRCYIMELDPKYVDVIIDRWERFTGKKAEKINEPGIFLQIKGMGEKAESNPTA